MKKIMLALIILSACKTEVKVEVPSYPQPVKETVIEGLSRPWSMAFLSESEVLLTEKDGDLLRIDLKTKEKHPIKGFPTDKTDSLTYKKADYSFGTFPGGLPDGAKVTYNAGILEVLTDPDYASNQQLYISYTAKGEGGATTKVISAQLQNDSLVNVKQLLLALPYSHGLFHFGGGMTFGADGKLYVTVGERIFNETNLNFPLHKMWLIEGEKFTVSIPTEVFPKIILILVPMLFLDCMALAFERPKVLP